MSYLDDLVASTRSRVADAKAAVGASGLEQRIAGMPAARDFAAALEGDDIAIIAEIKRASPLKGDLNLELNAGELAVRYVTAGASAISVLTEPDLFRGSFEDLRAATASGVPVLRKDFVIDDFQVLESRAVGADALLLIVRILGDQLLASLLEASTALGMTALVEVHDERELDRALAAGASLIGINHRDLSSFEVDPERTAKLAPLIPDGCLVVALSGVSSRAEVEELREAGAGAVLVGEALVTAADPEAKLRELLGRP